ncbi:MAG: RimJ/RimL family protein N-acetyltransferase [Candidatus Azotimanducaceae bacterium]|jgi:RimJ/RimL family protein N-acetyltransferase
MSDNQFGQPIGESLDDWKSLSIPSKNPMEGRFCRVVPMSLDFLDDLYEAYGLDDGRLWTYMSMGPFKSRADFAHWLASVCDSVDPMFHVIVDQKSAKAYGLAAYMRIQPGAGVIEIGSIAFSPLLQKTALATEAMFLFMQRAFDELGYRRYEWKCDSLNAPSRAAALRLGFSYEGLFRQALVYKNRNRDTTWFSILDSEWPRLKVAFLGWLDDGNFDENGFQRMRLQAFQAQDPDGKS